MTTDIVMDSYNRLPLLKRSIEYILERTKSPYRLFVIDDASTDGNAAYLRGLQREGKITKALLRRKHQGIPANWNVIPRITKSDVVVYTNGDVLCPTIEPDWIVHGLRALAHHPDIGMLSLNSPMCNAKQVLKVLGRRKGIVICDRVPSFFLFVRRDLMEKIKLPDVGKVFMGFVMLPNYAKIDRMWSRAAQAKGFQVGYLSGVYCQHIGLQSVRTGRDLSEWAVECDPVTLRPVEHKG